MWEGVKLLESPLPSQGVRSHPAGTSGSPLNLTGTASPGAVTGHSALGAGFATFGEHLHSCDTPCDQTFTPWEGQLGGSGCGGWRCKGGSCQKEF